MSNPSYTELARAFLGNSRFSMRESVLNQLQENLSPDDYPSIVPIVKEELSDENILADYQSAMAQVFSPEEMPALMAMMQTEGWRIMNEKMDIFSMARDLVLEKRRKAISDAI